MPKENFDYWSREIEEEPLDNVGEKIRICYENETPFSDDRINEIRCELEKIPNIVINFDETMTEVDTIGRVVLAIKALPGYGHLNFEERQLGFKEMISEWRNWKKDNSFERHDLRTPVKYFYEEVVSGVAYKDLLEIYEQLALEIPINGNLEKVFSYLRDRVGLKEIPLFALSLNNKDFLEMYYKQNAEYFQKNKVKLVGLVGNQVRVDQDGRIVGVIEHVTDENKSKYVPAHALMLADRRETDGLLEAGVNAVDVQGVRYKEILLVEAVQSSSDAYRAMRFREQLAMAETEEETKVIQERLSAIEWLNKERLRLRLTIASKKDTMEVDEAEVQRIVGEIRIMRTQLLAGKEWK